MMTQDALIPIPERHPRLAKNVAGDFYTTGECMQCTVPEHAAPDLLAELNDRNKDTHFIRQPTSPAEIDQACEAILSCCIDGLRYGGTDPEIIRRLGNRPSYCDFVLPGGPTPLPWENQPRALGKWFEHLRNRFRRR